jgi:hypothetical protein
MSEHTSDPINYRVHSLVDASSIRFASTDFGLMGGANGAGAISGQRMPELDGATAWLNSAPLSQGNLRGNVVLVNFWTYTCINWLRTLPYVRAWSDKYRSLGLVVIGVHTPEFPFEHDLENVRRAVRDMRIAYPVAVDSNYAIWDAFDNHYWPALYLVDADGRLRHSQFGEGGYEETEQTIQQLLTEAGRRSVSHDFVAVAANGAEVAADWEHLASGETYVGSARAENFASPSGAVVGERHVYTLPAHLSLNEWALSGAWTIREQAAALDAPNGRITLRFHARDLHLVMGPATQGTTVRFHARFDGAAPGVAHGGDCDAHGAGAATEQRLYQLIRQPQPIRDRLFEIEFRDAGVEAFAFTFG